MTWNTLRIKNGLSNKTMTDVLSKMKELGFLIKYDRLRTTCYYDKAGEMVKTLFIKDGQISSAEQAAKIGKMMIGAFRK